MDRLPWCGFHTIVVVALGITWILDGLEVTFQGAIAGILQHPETLHFTSSEIGLCSSFYLLGAVLGALIFGFLTDRLGRKKFFFISLSIYLTATALTALSWNLASYCLFRFFTGAGIGGEYTAINSAIDELIPARVRGQVDLTINGSYWIGAAMGSISTLVLLDPHWFGPNVGWRIGYGLGAAIGFSVLFLRRHVPESPRWLWIHGYPRQAHRVVEDIERVVARECGPLPPLTHRPRELLSHRHGFLYLYEVIVGRFRRRALVCLVLMVSQAFLYNAIFFTYALILSTFYGVPVESTGLYLLPFAIGNFLGPLLLGRLFDTVGRRPMIAGCYAISGILLLVTGALFARGVLTPTTQTILWMIIFFFASAAASSAYLTVSEIFPLQVRALALALFYALGTGIGGVVAPWLFGALIESHSRPAIFWAYTFAAALVLFAAAIQAIWGIEAAGKSLEELSH